MLPIPKFAKALAELAKDNPKVIPEKTLPQIKKGDNLEKKIEKQTKIDIDLLLNNETIEYEEMVKNHFKELSINEILSSVINKFKSKKHSKLLKIAKSIAKVNIYNSNERQLIEYINRFKVFFETFCLQLGNNDPMSRLSSQLCEIIDILKNDCLNKSHQNKLHAIVNEMHKISEYGGRKYEK